MKIDWSKAPSNVTHAYFIDGRIQFVEMNTEDGSLAENLAAEHGRMLYARFATGGAIKEPTTDSSVPSVLLKGDEMLAESVKIDWSENPAAVGALYNKRLDIVIMVSCVPNVVNIKGIKDKSYMVGTKPYHVSGGWTYLERPDLIMSDELFTDLLSSANEMVDIEMGTVKVKVSDTQGRPFPPIGPTFNCKCVSTPVSSSVSHVEICKYLGLSVYTTPSVIFKEAVKALQRSESQLDELHNIATLLCDVGVLTEGKVLDTVRSLLPFNEPWNGSDPLRVGNVVKQGIVEAIDDIYACVRRPSGKICMKPLDNILPPHPLDGLTLEERTIADRLIAQGVLKIC